MQFLYKILVYALMVLGSALISAFVVFIAPQVPKAVASFAGDVCFAAGDQPFGCLEFFANRYQTVFAAVVAFITAWIALQPVYGQLHETRKQSASAAVPTLERAVVARSDELKFFDNLGEQLEELTRNARQSAHNDPNFSLQDQINRMRDFQIQIDDAQTKHPGPEAVQRARERLGAAACSAANKLIETPPIGELRPHEIRALFTEINVSIVTARIDYRVAMEIDIKDRWAKIEKLERIAAGE